MAYPQDAVGRYVTNPIENRAYGGTELSKRQAGICDDLTRPMQRMIYLSAPRTGGPMPVQRGPAPLTRQTAFRGPPWNYTLLEYVPGLVTASSATNPGGTLTGWMSGCFLFRYTLGGKRYFAHVGTDIASPEKSVEAKRIWLDFVANSGATDIRGCNPAREAPMTALQAAQKDKLVPLIAGFLEPNGAARIVTFGKAQNDTSADFYAKVVAVDYMPLTDWATIKTDKVFA